MDDPKEKKNEEKNNYTRQLLIWGAVVLGFWLLYLAVLYWGHYILPIPDSLAQHSEAIGVFGDYFGALNALFAGLAFAGLIVTIHQQSADLKATKEEMRMSREEMVEQTQQFKKDYLSNSFYRRLELIQKLEKAVDYIRVDVEGKPENIHGERALEEIAVMMINVVDSVFPEIDRDKYTPNLNKVTYEAINFARTLTYLDTWMQSYTALIEDIDADFQNDHKERRKFFNILVKSTHTLDIVLLYAFHDTHLNCPIFDKLREDGIISDSRLHRGTLNKQTRLLLYNMWNELTAKEIMKLSAKERNDLGAQIILRYVNAWREAHGWEKRVLHKLKVKGINSGNEIDINVHNIMEQVKNIHTK